MTPSKRLFPGSCAAPAVGFGWRDGSENEGARDRFRTAGFSKWLCRIGENPSPLQPLRDFRTNESRAVLLGWAGTKPHPTTPPPT